MSDITVLILLPAFWTLGLSLLGYVVYIIGSSELRMYRSSLRSLRGPKRISWLRGSFDEVHEFDATRLQEQWVEDYGHTFVYGSVMGSQILTTVDIKALSHILNQGKTYQKSERARFSLGETVGKGLLFVEGADHKKQRRVMNPAFGPGQVRGFTKTFVEKAQELCDIWTAKISQSQRQDGRASLDAFAWMNKVTLDIIGLTGFDYSFDALHSSDDHPNELYEAIRTVFSFKPGKLSFVLQSVFPLFRNVPTERSRSSAKALATIRRIGLGLIAEKKAAVLAETGLGAKVEKQNVQGHDLLSLLIKANMAQDMSESMRMDDEEILSQVPTFLIAGHETTSTAVAWALFALSGNREAQKKLHKEAIAHPTDTPTMDELNAMPYLDAVVRETMRLYAPVAATQRMAVEDDVIPLSSPIIDKDGSTLHDIRITKGDTVLVPIRIVNRSAELWGEDANEYKPERWAAIPEAVHGIPSVFGNSLVFLAGMHACIGYRFSVVEMKALLFMISRSFEFELALPAEDIVRKTVIVGRPTIASNPDAPAQLPLLIRPASAQV